jgi:hypothetical protein
MEKFLRTGKIKSTMKQRCRLFARQEHQIHNELCVVKVYANMVELLATTMPTTDI